MKTLAVVGAGPALGMALARRFGREGYRVALLARNEVALDGFVKELGSEGVEAAVFPADILDRDGLTAALRRADGTFGPIDVLVFNAAPPRETLIRIPDLTPETLMPSIDYFVLGSVAAVNAVLPGMLDRGDGALLLTGALSGSLPVPSHASSGLVLAALKNYAYVLNAGLADKGVYAGTITIAGILIGSAVDAGPDDPRIGRFRIDPSLVADTYFDMVQRRDRVEEVVGDPDAIANAPFRW